MSCLGKFKASPQNIPNRCAKCSTAIDKQLVKINLDTVDRCVALYQDGARLMEEEKVQEAINSMCDGVDMFHEVARAPHRDTHLTQEALRSCFAAYGNVHIVKKSKEETNTDKKLEEDGTTQIVKYESS